MAPKANIGKAVHTDAQNCIKIIKIHIGSAKGCIAREYYLLIFEKVI